MAIKDKFKKLELGLKVTNLTGTLVGGVGGNRFTSWAEKRPELGEYAPYVPIATAALGGLIYIFTPVKPGNKLMSGIAHVGLGMWAVSGTESAEMGLAKMGLGGAMGYTPQQLGLGFTPQKTPVQFRDSVVYVNGTPVR